jgi:hypothetical protein
MIISYLHNFIFIKTRKTAGSSMEIALAAHAGPDDIVTPFGPVEEKRRQQSHPNSAPRNFCSDKELERKYREALSEGNLGLMKSVLREANLAAAVPVRRHDNVRRAMRAAGDAFWKKAYKFTIERHPYEKAVSLAWFERHQRDFSDALEQVLREKTYRNFDLYALDGKVAVDFVIRYEHFATDIPRVEAAIGIPIQMPRANAERRHDRRPAHDVLTPAQKKLVQETCREEFELFGYDA